MRPGAPSPSLLVAAGAMALGTAYAREPSPAGDGRAVELRRASGDPAAAAGARSVTLASLTLETVTTDDAQLARRLTMRGLSLDKLLDQLGPRGDADLALLQFRNGMVVPLPLDRATLDRLRPFVVVEQQLTAQPGLGPPSSLPRLSAAAGASEAPPRQFGQNRLAVRERWHPMLRPGSERQFSPWGAVDTLIGIELTTRARYVANFAVQKPTASVARGEQVFEQTCQFCHALGGVGGKLGLDFLDPEPIYSDRWMKTFRDAEEPLSGARVAKTELSSHVRFATRGGRTMPVLKHLSQSEAGDLWEWLVALAKQRGR